MSGLAGSGRKFADFLINPFSLSVPPTIRNDLIMLQYERVRTLIPILYLAIILTSIAAAMAVFGDKPYWEQFTPPAILIAASLVRLAVWRKRGQPVRAQLAWHNLRSTSLVTIGLGLVAGIWCCNAFRETEQYRCVVAPVFIALAALMAANCLSSLPRAATAAIIAAMLPITITMLLFDDVGIRAMAMMLITLSAIQIGLSRRRFDETIRLLLLQADITVLAETDPLTRLDNRRVFAARLDKMLAEPSVTVKIAMVDLNGFKPVNDHHGHAAGDEVLIQTGARLRQLFPRAICIARLGGDEFAIIFDCSGIDQGDDADIAAIRASLALPFVVGQTVIAISASVGAACAPFDASGAGDLIRLADRELYADKSSQQRPRHVEPTHASLVAASQ